MEQPEYTHGRKNQCCPYKMSVLVKKEMAPLDAEIEKKWLQPPLSKTDQAGIDYWSSRTNLLFLRNPDKKWTITDMYNPAYIYTKLKR